MYTQCPDCTSVFEISPEHLGAAAGMVQCGVCDTTFNALRRLTEAPPDEPASEKAPDTSNGERASGDSESSDVERDDKSPEKTADQSEQSNENTSTNSFPENAAEETKDENVTDDVSTDGDTASEKGADDETAGDDPVKVLAGPDHKEQADFFDNSSGQNIDHKSVSEVSEVEESSTEKPVSEDDAEKAGDTVNPDDLFSTSQVLDDWNTDKAEADLESAIQGKIIEDDATPAGETGDTPQEERDETDQEIESESESDTELESNPEAEPEVESEIKQESEPVPFDEDITDEVRILEDPTATSADLTDADESNQWDLDEGEQELQAVLGSNVLTGNGAVNQSDDEADEGPDESSGDLSDEAADKEPANGDAKDEDIVANTDDFFSTSQVLEEWDIDEGEHVLETLLSDDSLLDEIGVETLTGYVADDDDDENTDDAQEAQDDLTGKDEADVSDNQDDATSSIDSENDGQDGGEPGEQENVEEEASDADRSEEAEHKTQTEVDGEPVEPPQREEAEQPESDDAESEQDEGRESENQTTESSEDNLDAEFEAELEQLLGDEYLDDDLDSDEYYTATAETNGQSAQHESEPAEETNPADDDPANEADKETEDNRANESDTDTDTEAEAGENQANEPDTDTDTEAEADDDQSNESDTADGNQDHVTEDGENHSGNSDDQAGVVNEIAVESAEEPVDSNELLTQGVDGTFDEEDADDLRDLGDYLSPTKSLTRRLGEGLIVLLLLGGLAGQYVHYNRAELATHPEMGPHVQHVYRMLGKDLHANWLVTDYRVARHTIVPDEADTSLLLARATVVNNTAFERPLPLIRLQLKDRWGDAIYGRVFSPDEYLSDTPSGALAGNSRLEISLDLIHPAPEEEIGYSFDVCLDTPDGPDCGTPDIFTE